MVTTDNFDFLIFLLYLFLSLISFSFSSGTFRGCVKLYQDLAGGT